RTAPSFLVVSALSAELAPELAAISPAPERKAVEIGPSDPRQHRKTPLLAVVEALVERSRCVGIALERRTAVGQGLRLPLRPLHRIARAIPAVADRIQPLSPLRGEFAVGLLEGWPEHLLIGRQLESGMERGQARIEKSGAILGARLPAPPAVPSARR